MKIAHLLKSIILMYNTNDKGSRFSKERSKLLCRQQDI